MSRKLSLKFIEKSYWAITYAILLGAAMLAMTGCTPRQVSSKEARPEKAERPDKKELVGKWQKIPAGGQYAEYAKYAENMGNFESYEITEDGRVTNETLIATRNYDCPVEVSTKSDGKITVSSETQLNISLDAGTIQQRNGCSAEKNSTGSTKATSTDFQWKISKDDDGTTELYLTQPNGETVRYRRVK